MTLDATFYRLTHLQLLGLEISLFFDHIFIFSFCYSFIFTDPSKYYEHILKGINLFSSARAFGALGEIPLRLEAL